MGYIYKIEHVESGKVYIGQTSNRRGPLQRFHHHCSPSGKNPFIKKIVKKEGKEALSFNVLEECSEELMDAKEMEYIEKYNSLYPNGFNLQYGGTKGWKNTQRAIDAVSKSLIKSNKEKSIGVYVEDTGDFYESINEFSRNVSVTAMTAKSRIIKRQEIDGLIARFDYGLL
jgi:hypothetical protein